MVEFLRMTDYIERGSRNQQTSFSLRRRAEGRQKERARDRETQRSLEHCGSCSSADKKAMKRFCYLTNVLEEISTSIAPGGLRPTPRNAQNLKFPNICLRNSQSLWFSHCLQMCTWYVRSIPSLGLGIKEWVWGGRHWSQRSRQERWPRRAPRSLTNAADYANSAEQSETLFLGRAIFYLQLPWLQWE